VRAATAAIDTGLRGVTLNLDSWEDFEFLVALRRFFAFRRGRRELRGSLAHRLRALQRLSEAQRVLRRRAPARVAALTRKLAASSDSAGASACATTTSRCATPAGW
jgi:hypothetical protein